MFMLQFLVITLYAKMSFSLGRRQYLNVIFAKDSSPNNLSSLLNKPSYSFLCFIFLCIYV